MRRSYKIVSAHAAAGILATSTSAFTASTTMPTGGVTGYGQTTCNTPDNPLLNTFDTRGLSVV